MAGLRDAHWQEAWRQASLDVAQRIPGRRKFFAVNAYPGTSGFFHIGHLRGYAYLDALLRFHRMLGEQVFLPFGVHASGLPAVTFAQRVADRNPAALRQLETEGIPPDERARFATPEGAVRGLGESYARVLRSVGVLFDPTSYLTTIDDDYRSFIRWQFRTLGAAGSLVQGTHYASFCPVCGPVAVDPTETDLSSGGTAETVAYTTVPFHLEDGRILLAATLRPETVYGVTNLWVAPGESLVVWHLGERSFLTAPAGAERLVEQHGGKVGHRVPSQELLGQQVSVPLGRRRVPILESRLVDPALGTGVVMSVPAHAPADAAALADLPSDHPVRAGAPPVLLEVVATAAMPSSEVELVAGGGTPAERALRAVGARSLADREKVDTATERLYRLEYLRGRMTVPELSGVSVRDARDRVARELEATGASFVLREFSVPVVCRNGHAVGIRRVPDQWFLHYSDPAWKALTRSAISQLRAWPEEYGRELPAILDWFEDRPCTRRGRWLGTPFPLDPTWTIEPIADSTFYMAFFIVRRYVASGRLALPQLTDAFFNYVFRGQGPAEPTVERSLLEELRAEFLYWYPLDMNMGGSEHKRVHFPVFLFTHARLLPAELQPRSVFVNGWITGPTGDKVSKKDISAKGGRIPTVERALAQWGADALRLYYIVAASPDQDVEWDSDLVGSTADRLAEIGRLVRAARGDTGGPPELDEWLLSELHRVVARVRQAYLDLDLRSAADGTYVRLPALLRRYYARGGVPGTATDRLADAWVRLLSPITPHLAEELGEGRSSGLVARSPFPEASEYPASPPAEARETFLDRVEADVRAVLRPSADRGESPPEAIAFFTAAPWKRTVEGWMRQVIDTAEGPTVRTIMARASTQADLTAARSEIPKYVQRVAPLLRGEPRDDAPEVDEAGTLRAAEGYLSRRLGFRTVAVYPEAEAAPHDPLGRRERARPGRPAFYLRRAPER